MITWDEFWSLISTLDGRAEQDRCARLSEALARRPVHEITGFGERLAEALYRLDREEFGLLPVTGMGSPDDPFPQSADVFLYSRCAVVAAGRHAYDSVADHPLRFAPFTAPELDGEWLLYVAPRAHQQTTGRAWDQRTRFCFESYSNRDGWPRHR
ncbi:DUF4240 domain-containing protein (plasmid) [Streptomycetaceae bacterium NBC_01309]